MRKKIGKLNIYIDEKIELLGIVQYLSNYGERYPFLVTIEENLYTKKVNKYFESIKGHSVISKFEELSYDGFDFHIPPEFMLHLNENLDIKNSFDDELLERSSGIDEAKNFIKLLKNFSSTSNFKEFIIENQIFYDEIIHKFTRIIDGIDYIKILEEYFGEAKKSYNLIPVPLFSHGNYGIKVKDSDGQENIYAILAGFHLEDMLTKELIINLLWHEFSHSFVNHLADVFEDESSTLDVYFKSMDKFISKTPYNELKYFLGELIVRAITIRLIYRNISEDLAYEFIKRDKEFGFIHIEELCNKLKEYEENREIYKSFKSFYKEILLFLKTLPPVN